MRLSSFVTDPLGRSATCSYNADDHVTSTTDRDGRRTTFSYDSGGRETGETWYDSSGQVTGHITFTYDNTGRMTGADDPNALLTFTYDSRGNQLTAATSGPGTGQPDVTLSSAYDGNNNRTSLADNLSTSNTITYDYDLANRMTTIGFSASTGSYAVAFGYDSGGNVTSVDRLAPSMFGLGNPTTTTIAYDAANRVTTMTDYSYTTSMSGGTTTPLGTYVYGYDNANRVTSETDKEGLVTLSYDSGGQLLTARGSRTENYSYDSGGNRDMTGYTTGTGNELTASPGATYAYDGEGNMTGETQLSTGDGWTFGYDNRNRMVAAEEKSSGGTILCQVSYTYDAENRRIGEDVNGTRTWTVYDGQNAYDDFNGSGALQHRYIMGAAVDEVLGRIDSSGNVAWYLTDRLGTVRDVVNTTGTVLDHVVYDSYGDVTSETNATNGDRFKFTGREYDAATGMYYYRARYYDPETGRFEEQDPMGFAAGDADLYRYVGNGPANATDPTGNKDELVSIDTREVFGKPIVLPYENATGTEMKQHITWSGSINVGASLGLGGFSGNLGGTITESVETEVSVPVGYQVVLIPVFLVTDRMWQHKEWLESLMEGRPVYSLKSTQSVEFLRLKVAVLPPSSVGPIQSMFGPGPIILPPPPGLDPIGLPPVPNPGAGPGLEPPPSPTSGSGSGQRPELN